ncbi:hypothetical protein C0J52_06462 [Blattella germanica]|nr:hypothetical protein C0J52_06462 [Blattella germanica]
MDRLLKSQLDQEDEVIFTDSSVQTCIIYCDGKENRYYKYLLQAAMKTTYLTDDIIKKLKNLNITEPDSVPLAHTVQKSLAHSPSAYEIEKLQLLGVDLVSKFTPEEDEIIQTNWEKFSKEYGFESPLPFILPKYKNVFYPKRKEQDKFIMHLGSELPLRSLHRIYRRFCHLYRCCWKGRFKKAEDKLIVFHCQDGKDSEPFSTLSRILGRTKQSVWTRMQYLKSHLNETKPVKWKSRDIHSIVKNLLEVTGYEKLTDLYNQNISMDIWKEVGRRCLFNPVALEKFWKRKLSTQLFSSEWIYLNATRIKLICRLYEGNMTTWGEVDWNNIAKYFEGVSPYFLKSVFKKLLKTCYPDKEWETMKSNFQDSIPSFIYLYPCVMDPESCTWGFKWT